MFTAHSKPCLNFVLKRLSQKNYPKTNVQVEENPQFSPYRFEIWVRLLTSVSTYVKNSGGQRPLYGLKVSDFRGQKRQKTQNCTIQKIRALM